jgi:hypothetical protein
MLAILPLVKSLLDKSSEVSTTALVNMKVTHHELTDFTLMKGINLFDKNKADYYSARRCIQLHCWAIGFTLYSSKAQVVKLVDTLASGASALTGVEVQVLSWAPTRLVGNTI